MRTDLEAVGVSMGMTFRLAETGDIPVILRWLDCPQGREWAVGRATLTSADIEA